MVKEPRSETAAGPLGWLQDQLHQLKGQVAQLEQQLEQLRSTATEMSEGMRTVEASLREAALRADRVPRLQEEINQSAALILQLQDQQAEAKERLDLLGGRGEEEDRDRQKWSDVAHRVEQLERQAESRQDRQTGGDEAGRRLQGELSLLRQEVEQRLEAMEGKAVLGLEKASRAEQTLSQVETTILKLQREDESIAERARVAAEVAHRLESTLNRHLEALQRAELLAERIELHRAERQRLEDRAVRLEEELGELRSRADQQEEQQGHLGSQQQGLAARFDSFQEQEEQRAVLVELLRKLVTAQGRTKRRQIQELEREIREMKRYGADLTNQ